MKSPLQTRRRFLGHASCAAVSSLPLLNTLLNLRLAGSIANAAPPENGEYRALVCLFMSGGNDSFNMLTPYGGPSTTHEDSHVEYTASRGNLALSKEDLHEIHPLNISGRTFGVHPSMPKLAARFEAGDAAFVANVGTLIEPVQNRLQVAAASKRLPLGLYSHSDQIEQWQTSVPHSRSGIGWAGRMMDLIKDINPSQLVSMNISMDGSNVFQSGVSGAEYAVNPVEGAVALAGYSAGYSGNGFTDAASSAVDGMLAQQYGNLLQDTFQKKRRDAQDAYALYSSATSADLPGNIVFPQTSLGRQLRQVAKALMGRAGLGALRQTFFVNRGGWDHHSDTLLLQQSMLGEVDDAVGAFWDQLVALGIENQVTLFSGSDFGRTLTSNDRGSDHAWGGNHFVLGGSVDGRKIYGPYPSLALNPDTGAELNPLDTGRGRLIPTVSCDEYFGELAVWLGVPASSISLVLPNIGNFIATGGNFVPLGFLGNPQAPQNTGLPEISFADGNPGVTTGSWAGGPTGHTYAWYVNGELVPSETGANFTGSVATGDELHAIVTAINEAGATTALSNTFIVQAPEAAGVTLYWDDISDNESGFRFEWGIDGVDFPNVVEIAPHVTSSRINFPGPGTYHGRVRAYNSAGESAPSNILIIPFRT